ncbi:rod shape-determining protein RodA [Candidatus Roizmanbacteria bacterium]|nr:rod shape-determining protein RodA [Candidatus Roizmanbacteria bacterium]
MRLLALLICLFSLLIVRAITPDLFMYQLLWIAVGVIAYILVSRIDTKVFEGLWPLWYVLLLGFLALSLFGPEVRGSHRWIDLFGVRMQPSELLKPVYVLSLAAYLSSTKEYTIGRFLRFTGLFLIPTLIVFKQPDLGNSLVYSFIVFALLFASFFPFVYYIAPFVLSMVVTPFLWEHLAAYQKLRIITFINPGYDLQGAGYNARQALIAVGSGGWFGKGLGEGTQSKLQFLPEFHTDFIFASTVEQLGFVGGLFLLLLYFLLLLKILKVARNTPDTFCKLYAYGLFGQLFIQVIINVGMNIGILPITGITLPLFSFGGSSMIATWIGLGILGGFPKPKEHPVAIG